MPLAFDPNNLVTPPEEEKRIQEGDLFAEGRWIVEVTEADVNALSARLEEKDGLGQEAQTVGALDFDESDGNFLRVGIVMRVDESLNDPAQFKEKFASHSQVVFENCRVFNPQYDSARLAPNLQRMHDMNMRTMIAICTAARVVVPDVPGGGKNWFMPFIGGKSAPLAGARLVINNKWRSDPTGRKFNGLRYFPLPES